MMRKVIALVVLVVVMLGLAVSIERTARPIPDREAVAAGDSHEGHEH
jgi:hypothetical protein